MHTFSPRTLLLITLLLTAFIIQNGLNLALAQGGGQQNNQNNQNNHQTGGGGQQAQNNTSSSQPSNNTTTNNNKTTTAGGQNGNQTNITSIAPSSTPITFPLAPLPSSGPLAGTYQAPFPAEGQGQNGQNALGPDDNYIAAAVALLPASTLTLQLLCTFAVVVLAGATLL